IVKYIQINYNSFLKSDLNLDNSIKDFTNTYDEASLILTNLKKIKAITEKDYISMNNSLNKLDFNKISNKLLFLTLKNNSSDILGEKKYFEGLIAELMFKNDLAEKYYSKALELNIYNPKYYNALGRMYYKKYDFNKAIDAFENGLNIPDFNSKKYRDLRFILLMNLAKTYSTTNNLNDARNAYTYISINAKNSNNINYEYLAVYNLANIEVSVGNYKVAIDYLKYSLKLASKLNNKEYTAQSLNFLSAVNYKYGDYINGKKNGLKAIKLAKRLSNLRLMADASLNVCLNYEYLYKMDLANVYCKKAIRINNVLSNNLRRPEYFIKNGYIYSFVASVRNYQNALSEYEEAYKISNIFGLKLLEIKSMYGLSESNNMLGNKVKSIKYLDDISNLETMLNIEEQACDSCKYGFIYWGQKEYQKAINYYEAGLIKAFIQNNKVILANISSHLASINFELQNYKEALKYSTLSLNTDKKIYRYDHHYIKYQENWQDKIIKEMNNKGVNSVNRKDKSGK
ncbi:MAG: hypothetical protein PHY80_06175, partial [Rickettsiales bacterium]|nr:hypothetical protein [Rickettsiales bacterium]